VTDTIICPNCQHENSLDAVECVQCGNTLNSDRKVETIPVTDLLPTIQAPERGVPAGLRRGAIALYVMGERDPILVEVDQRIILGRSVFGEPPPNVDLTDHHGRLLGVSRHHAAIHVSNDTFMIEDLDSSNGTWVNDNRVQPGTPVELGSGDVIRLGQLVLFVYFQETPGANADERPRPPAPRPEAKADLRAVEITLVGRPSRVDVHREVVVTTMLHQPAERDLPENVPGVFQRPSFYTVYIPIPLWRRIDAALTNPSEQFIIQGSVAYDPEVGRIAVYATKVSTKSLEAARAKQERKTRKRPHPKKHS
jgi:hypothetical protein